MYAIVLHGNMHGNVVGVYERIDLPEPREPNILVREVTAEQKVLPSDQQLEAFIWLEARLRGRPTGTTCISIITVVLSYEC